MTQLATRMAGRVRPAHAAFVMGAVALCLGLLAYLSVDGASIHGFHPDGEGNVPALYSAVLLAATATLAFLLGADAPGRDRVSLRVMAAFFLFMAFDEFFEIHEALERSTEIDWQILYAPVVLVGAIAWLATLRLLWPLRAASAMFVLGAIAWLVAQAFEVLQYDSDRLVEKWVAIPEELLEMAGSSLFCLALLVALRASGPGSVLDDPVRDSSGQLIRN